MRGLALVLAAVVLVTLFSGGSAGECCRPHPGWDQGQVTLNCGDCKPGTPYCGVGRCNFWGCNCDGGCRKGTCGGMFSPQQVFDIVDTNKDGKISHKEAHVYMTNSGVDVDHLPPILQSPTLGAIQAASENEFLPNDVITLDNSQYDRCAGAHP